MKNKSLITYCLFAVIMMVGLSCPIFGQTQQKPQIYLTRRVPAGPGKPTSGGLVILDALTLQETYEVNFDGLMAMKVEVNNDQSIAYILCRDTVDPNPNAVIAFDLINKKILATAYQRRWVSSVKIAPDGLVYILLDQEKALEKVDANLNLISRIPLEQATKSIIFDSGKAFISLENSLAILDLQSNILKTIPMPVAPNGIFENFYFTNDLVLGENHFLYSSRGKSLFKIDTIGNVVTEFKNLHEAYTIGISADSQYVFRVALDTIGSSAIYIDNVLSGQEDPDPINVRLGDFHLKTLGMAKNNSTVLYALDESMLYLIDITSKSTITTRQYILRTPGMFPTLITNFQMIGDFGIGMPPVVGFTDIKEGDTLQKGSLFNVTWKSVIASDSFVPVLYKVTFMEGQGSEVALMNDDPSQKSDSLSGDTTNFMWRIPFRETTGKLKIVVTDAGGRTDMQILNVKIADKPQDPSDTQAPTVKFNSPNGGEAFIVGDALKINWTSRDNVGVVRQDLSLSTDGGNTFPITIATGLRGEVQSFTFSIPDNAVTTNARLKLVVSDAAGNAAQSVTKDFTIKAKPDNQAPVVTISTPNGQTFLAGQPINVNWQTIDNGTVMSQAILLSLDGGMTFPTIAAFGAKETSFVLKDITALSQTISQAQVKIIALDSNGNMGEAVASFSIAPVITMATYSKKVLDVSGLGFLANGSNASYQLMVNGKTVSSFAFSGSNTSFSFKGNKKKLGIVKGSNTVQLLVNGQSSNSRSFMF